MKDYWKEAHRPRPRTLTTAWYLIGALVALPILYVLWRHVS